jgi:hypothetical protein
MGWAILVGSLGVACDGCDGCGARGSLDAGQDSGNDGRDAPAGQDRSAPDVTEARPDVALDLGVDLALDRGVDRAPDVRPDLPMDLQVIDEGPLDFGIDRGSADHPPDAPGCPGADAGRCPVGQVCVPPSGCVPGGFAVDGKTLYAVALPSGAVAPIADTSVPIADLALAPDGTLLGTDGMSLFQIDAVTGAASLLTSVQLTPLNALEASGSGAIFGATHNGNFAGQIDRATGIFSGFIILPGPTPNYYTSSGDLAISGTTAYVTMTAAGLASDALGSADLTAASPPQLMFALAGSIGFACVEGLMAQGNTLYGLTCNGELLRIDPATGAGTLLEKTGYAFTGAAAR